MTLVLAVEIYSRKILLLKSVDGSSKKWFDLQKIQTKSPSQPTPNILAKMFSG